MKKIARQGHLYGKLKAGLTYSQRTYNDYWPLKIHEDKYIVSHHFEKHKLTER